MSSNKTTNDTLDYLPFFYIGLTIIYTFLKCINIKQLFIPEFKNDYFQLLLKNNNQNQDPDSSILQNKQKIITTLEQKKKQNGLILIIIYFILLLIISISIASNHLSVYCELTSTSVITNTIYRAILPFLMIVIVYFYISYFPGLKNIFANVFGYLIIYVYTNNIIATILKDDYKIISYTSTLTKLLNNEFILINKLSPTNFYDVMSVFIQEQRGSNSEINNNTSDDNLKKLYDAIYVKDYIGEFFWLLYTCIFVSTLITFYISLLPVSQ